MQDARERIVDTACKLFYYQGYNTTGINQIIKEAEVAKASLYQYFPSKEDLLIEYLKTTAVKTNNALQQVVDAERDPRNKVLALFKFLYGFSDTTAYTGCNFLNMEAETAKENLTVRALIKNQKDHMRNLFASILKPIGKEDLADEMYLLFDGAQVSFKIYEDKWPIDVTMGIVEKLI